MIVAEDLVDVVWPEKFIILPEDIIKVEIKFKGGLEPKSVYELRVDCSVKKMEYAREIREEAIVKHVRGFA